MHVCEHSGRSKVIFLATLYALSDWSIQQLAIGLAVLPLLVGLAWYGSQPAHRVQLMTATSAEERPPRMAA